MVSSSSRYVNLLGRSPNIWFRARDCAALCANDIDDPWFTEEQLQVLSEIGVTFYDTVAFFKHRAEGEVGNTFAYLDPELRGETHGRAREVLWSFDAAWGKFPRHLVVLNFLQPFRGPLQIMMRRYRCVEDGMVIGKPETQEVVELVHENYKLCKCLSRIWSTSSH